MCLQNGRLGCCTWPVVLLGTPYGSAATAVPAHGCRRAQVWAAHRCFVQLDLIEPEQIPYWDWMHHFIVDATA
jgi:phosphoketolase